MSVIDGPQNTTGNGQLQFDETWGADRFMDDNACQSIATIESSLPLSSSDFQGQSSDSIQPSLSSVVEHWTHLGKKQDDDQDLGQLDDIMEFILEDTNPPAKPDSTAEKTGEQRFLNEFDNATNKEKLETKKGIGNAERCKRYQQKK